MLKTTFVVQQRGRLLVLVVYYQISWSVSHLIILKRSFILETYPIVIGRLPLKSAVAFPGVSVEDLTFVI
jgi:hypothetical protein